jgi:hypothetical protein
VRIARVKVGNRQAPYAVRPEPRWLRKSTGVLAFGRVEKTKACPRKKAASKGGFCF